MREKTGRLTEEAAILGLKLNTRKCKTLRTEFSRNRESILVNGEEVEGVEEFAYLEAIVDKEGGGSKDIRNRLQKARGAFQRLWKVWAARGIGRRAKIRLFKTLVRPVLLYGCVTWKITKTNERKLNSFQSQCLRRIMRIRWQQRTKNNRVAEKQISMKRRRWNWLGHVPRREGVNDCLRYWGGHKRVEGRDRDQRLLGEELSKEREGQGGVAEPECGQGGGTQQGGLGGQCDGLMRLQAQRAMMMMMRTLAMYHLLRFSVREYVSFSQACLFNVCC